MAGLVLLLAACSKPATPTTRVNLEDAPLVFGKLPAEGGAEPSDRPQSEWSITLAAFRGAEAQAMAQQGVAKVQAQAGLTEAFVRPQGPDTFAVSYGRYPGPSDARAQEDLARIKAIRIGDGFPFLTAMLTPIGRAHAGGSSPEFDLSTVKRRVGKGAIYTLQIAIYRRPDGSAPTAEELASFRSAAEQAVADLRREGEEAYYYHGLRGSTVTVGVFGNRDYEAQKTDEQGNVRMTRPIESMALQEARKRHPYNLLNGQGIKVRTPGQKEGQLQLSPLVAIPD